MNLPTLDEARQYAPVLARMIDILAEDNITFGAAMEQASRETGIEVPEHMQAPMLRVAFKMFSGGGFPGAPEA